MACYNTVPCFLAVELPIHAIGQRSSKNEKNQGFVVATLWWLPWGEAKNSGPGRKIRVLSTPKGEDQVKRLNST